MNRHIITSQYGSCNEMGRNGPHSITISITFKVEPKPHRVSTGEYESVGTPAAVRPAGVAAVSRAGFWRLARRALCDAMCCCRRRA